MLFRSAGFRRLQPVVPEGAAFGAAIEQESHGDHAGNQCQTPEHRPAPPGTDRSYPPNRGVFKPVTGGGRALSPGRQCALQWRRRWRENGVSETAAAEFGLDEATQ